MTKSGNDTNKIYSNKAIITYLNHAFNFEKCYFIE